MQALGAGKVKIGLVNDTSPRSERIREDGGDAIAPPLHIFT